MFADVAFLNADHGRDHWVIFVALVEIESVLLAVW